MSDFIQTGTAAFGGEPVTLNDVEGQCRIVDLSAEASTIELMISAVREKAEIITCRALIAKTEVLTLNNFPANRAAIKLIKPPLKSVTSVVYIDANGVEQTLSSSLYRVITNVEPGYIVPVHGQSWPVTLPELAVITITYECGYLIGDIPKAIKQWMLLNIATLYENRESQGVAMGRSTVFNLDETLCDGLIESYRILHV